MWPIRPEWNLRSPAWASGTVTCASFDDVELLVYYLLHNASSSCACDVCHVPCHLHVVVTCDGGACACLVFPRDFYFVSVSDRQLVPSRLGPQLAVSQSPPKP